MELENENILFLVRTMGLGGTENVVLQLCEILCDKVKKIVVCSSGGVHEEKLKTLGISHYTIPDIASKKTKDMLKIYLAIRTIIKNEKITIIHSHHRMAAFYAQLAAPKEVVKIANAHNTFNDKRKLTKFAYHNTKIVAVGEMVKRNLIDFFGIPNDQVSVIHNAIKPFVEEVKSILVLDREKAEEHILIGNIGRLSEQKGMNYFIDAAEIVTRSHPEARFIIVGEGELKDQLFEQVRNKKLQNKVLFLGYRGDIQNVISQLDFIVLSSLWEGLPLTPIEAYSVGKTVIGTAVDGTIEIIRDGMDGYLVKPRNSVQLAEKMSYLIEHPNIKQNMEYQARKRYETEFSFEKLEQSYLNFYKELREK